MLSIRLASHGCLGHDDRGPATSLPCATSIHEKGGASLPREHGVTRPTALRRMMAEVMLEEIGRRPGAASKQTPAEATPGVDLHQVGGWLAGGRVGWCP